MNTQTGMSDDELLSAYLDGELEPATLERLTERLVAEPMLADRLADMHRANAAHAELYSRLDQQPVPPAVLALLNKDSSATREARTSASIIPFPQGSVTAYLQRPVAIAASVALVAGFLVSTLLRDGPDTGSGLDAAYYAGNVATDSELHRLLESGRSAEPQPLTDDSNGQIVLSFQTDSGEYCRQLEVIGPGHTMGALACRNDDKWQLRTASFGRGDAMQSGYSTASAENPALGAAVRALMREQPPLSPQAEAELIASGWDKGTE